MAKAMVAGNKLSSGGDWPRLPIPYWSSLGRAGRFSESCQHAKRGRYLRIPAEIFGIQVPASKSIGAARFFKTSNTLTTVNVPNGRTGDN
jgi:hypothetical protein